MSMDSPHDFILIEEATLKDEISKIVGTCVKLFNGKSISDRWYVCYYDKWENSYYLIKCNKFQSIFEHH